MHLGDKVRLLGFSREKKKSYFWVMTVAHMTINPVGHCPSQSRSQRPRSFCTKLTDALGTRLCPIPAKDIKQKHDPSLLDLVLVNMADFNVSIRQMAYYRIITADTI